MTNEESFAAASQDHWNTRVIDSTSCRTDAFHRRLLFVKWMSALSCTVFDRETGDARRNAQRHVLSHTIRFVGVTGKKIGIHWQRSRSHNFADVREHRVERNRSVGNAAAKGITCRGGSKGFESQMLQIASASHIPRIRQNETSRFVQCAKLRDGGGLGRIQDVHNLVTYSHSIVLGGFVDMS